MPRLTLAKRYLWGALTAALLPLVVMAALYDVYTANLLNNLFNSKVESNLEAASVKINNFVSVQVSRLDNIADLPDTTAFFRSSQHQLSERLSDFLLLETQSPDIYGIEFSDVNGEILATVPPSASRAQPLDQSELPLIEYNGVDVLGPILPHNGRPGWVLMTKPVYLNRIRIGFVSLRIRLASLTEQSSLLIQPNVYEPQIVVFDRVFVSPVGTAVDKQAGDGAQEFETLAKSRQFMPGWRIHLVEQGGQFDEPRVRIRYILLLLATLSAMGLVWLFMHMSERLARFLEPLTEGARAISNGNFSRRVSEDGPGELGSLGRSFNKMSSQLGAMINSRVDVERKAALGNMAAGIAHEIRNPLATVNTTLHGLKRGEDEIYRREMYDVISDEIYRVDKTIGEFLKYAKPSEPVREFVLIRDVFDSVTTLTAASAHEKGIIFNILGDSGLKVKIDPAHLKQMLLNLTLNAIEAISHKDNSNDAHGHIILKAHKDKIDGKDYAIISVSDDGVGFDRDTALKVLRPFFTTRSGGTGLGLSITNQLVRDNGGEMTIESEFGQGTLITLMFPMDEPDKVRE